MRIGFIGQKGIPATYGGIEDFTEQVAIRLAERGHQVTVYCRPYYSSSPKTYRRVNLKTIRSITTKHLDALSHTFLCSLDSLSKRFDIVVYQALGPSSFCFIPKIWGNVKVATIIHSLDWQRSKWNRMAKFLLKLAESPALKFPDLVTVISKDLKSYFEQKFQRKVEGITPGTKTPIFRGPDRIGKLGLEKEKYILYLGRLVPEKGCHYLISAFTRIKTDMKLFIGGNGFFSDDYTRSLKSQKSPRIVFGGYVDQELKQELLSNAYLYVLPSELEGMSQSVMEALSYGRCVLVSDIRANLETCGKWGYTFKNKNTDDLKDKLIKLLNNEELVRKDEQKRIEYVKENFSWDKTADDLERLFEDCFNHRKSHLRGER